jgi:hypothetical protein
VSLSVVLYTRSPLLPVEAVADEAAAEGEEGEPAAEGEESEPVEGDASGGGE